MDIIVAPQCLELGLQYIGINLGEQQLMSAAHKLETFQSFYGATPLDIAEIWYDLQQGHFPAASLTPEENSLRGFKQYMIAHFFLFSYPRNSVQTSVLFGVQYLRPVQYLLAV
jgi:hypothetical protein